MGTHYSRVTQADRISIQALMQAKHNGPEIARQLGLSRSTVNREINRSKALPTALATDDQAGTAQQRSQAQRRAGVAARRKLGADLESPLRSTVLTGLRSRWSPQQIAGKLPRMAGVNYPGRRVASRRYVTETWSSSVPVVFDFTRDRGLWACGRRRRRWAT